MTFDEIAKMLFAHGILGIFTAVAMYVAWNKDKDLKAERQEFQKRLDEIQEKHREEIQQLSERYILRAETWMSKFHELVDAQNETLGQLTAFVDRQGKPLSPQLPKRGV